MLYRVEAYCAAAARMAAAGCGIARRRPTGTGCRAGAGSRQDDTVDDTNKDQKRYCPYCGMTSFEVSGEEEGSLYCEYCGVDVEVRELIP
jgi:ribosomal protein L37AE/L43A